MTSGRRAIIPAALTVATFAVCYWLALALRRTGVFGYVDVLFEADAAWFLEGFGEGSGTGTGWGARSVVHPNVANFANPPLRLMAAICSTAGACGPAEAARSTLALMVSPAAAAIETLFVFLAIRTIHQSDSRALIVALLNLALLPTLLFGAVPESFALTGCALSAFFYLASRAATGRAVPVTWWVLVGIALTSITITNVALFAAGVLLVRHRERPLLESLLGAVRLSAVALAITAALALTIGFAYGALSDYRTPLQQLADVRAPREDLAERRWSDAAVEQIGLAVSGAFSAFPRALGDTLLPPQPAIRGQALVAKPGGAEASRPSDPPMQATYRDTRADWGTFLTLAALAGAALMAAACRGPGRVIYQVAMALIAANWCLHSVFGLELFLYSKHWSVAVAMLLAAWLERARTGAIVVVALVVLAGARELGAITYLLRALAGS